MEELRRLTPLDLKPEITPQSFKEKLKPLRDGSQEQIVFETVHKRKDGSHYDVEVYLQLMHAETPSVFVAIIQDISERKEAEEALRQSEVRFRDIAESTSDWIWETDADLRFSHYSNRLKEATGVDPEGLLGKTRQDLGKGDIDDEKWRRHLADLDARRPFRDFRYTYKHEDGCVLHFSTSGKPVFDDDGRFTGYRGTGADITAQVEAEERARSAQERLAIAVEGLSELFVLFDADDRIVMSNQAWRDLNRAIPEWSKPGVRFEDHLRGAIKAGLVPQAVGREEEWLAERMERHRNPGKPFEVARQDGCWMLVNEQRLTAGGTVLIISDISETKRAEARLRESEARFRTILDNSPTKIHVKDLEGRYVLINRLSEELFGVTDAEARGKTTAEIFPKEIADAFMGHDREVIETGDTIEEEEEWTRKDGVHTFLTVKFPIPDADGNISAVGAIGTDITERKRSQAHIEQIALHDTLTGLPNRFLFHQRLGEMLAQAKRHEDKLALMFLDLDDFKGVNDTLGHDAGDELLKAVAERLQAQLRETDILSRRENTLARLGGDEFILILTDLADPMDSVTVAERILARMGNPFSISGNEVHCSISIGIAIYPTHGTDPEQLLKTADMALYRAKAEGRNTYCFYSEELEAQVLVRKTVEADLRKAMEEDQLSLAYQPQIDVMSGRTVGLEALLRWNHPERGPILPETFIPVAEATGLILPIGQWVLEQACAQNKAWQDAGLSAIPVAVNISPVQFQQEDVLATVETALRDSGLDPAHLYVEITESLVMRDDFVSSGVLHGLRRLGVKIALDDFGTGYSSLSYLMQLPVDKIKLDRGFLHDIEYDQGGAAIVKAMTSLGHSLGMRVTIEGAETLNQVAVLSSSGVDEIQGFYFSEALGPEAVLEFLSETTESSDRAMAGV
jgi:diguanylate cyclase (GGDEF)-like protein/PAS domain S-box-containing protein